MKTERVLEQEEREWQIDRLIVDKSMKKKAQG